MPFDSFVPIFQTFTGNQLSRESTVAVTDITFKLASDITRAQLAEGVELFFFVNGYVFENDGRNVWKIARK
jgi:hypothetical protein